MSVFTLPFTIEPASETELQAAALGICARCALASRPIEGRNNNSTVEIKYRGGGHDWYQCTRCLRVFVTEPKRT